MVPKESEEREVGIKSSWRLLVCAIYPRNTLNENYYTCVNSLTCFVIVIAVLREWRSENAGKRWMSENVSLDWSETS